MMPTPVDRNMHQNPAVSSSTKQLFDQYILPTYGRFPLELERGKGSRVWDTSGKEYLDFGAGIAVCSLGHAHPRVAKTLAEQAGILGHVSNLYYTRLQGLLAQRIVELVGTPGRCFFCNSGAEANEALYKLARRFGNLTSPGGRHEIITFRQSFHGRTLAGIAATGQEKVRVGFEPLTPGFVQATYNDLSSVEAVVNDRTAAVLLEPIQGESGIVPATADFLRGLRQLCDQRNLLLMLDEVQCGFGRTGDWCAWRTLGAPEIEPDAISWAKGMAAGFPMGAMWARDRVITLANGKAASLGDLFGPGSHGTTFGGNPLGCAVALSTFDVIKEEDLLNNAARMGALAKQLLIDLGSPWISELRGVGLMLGIQLNAETITSRGVMSAADRAPALQLVDRLQEAGLLTVPAGTHVIRWLPPLNVSRADVMRAVEISAGVLHTLG